MLHNVSYHNSIVDLFESPVSTTGLGEFDRSSHPWERYFEMHARCNQPLHIDIHRDAPGLASVGLHPSVF